MPTVIAEVRAGTFVAARLCNTGGLVQPSSRLQWSQTALIDDMDSFRHQLVRVDTQVVHLWFNGLELVLPIAVTSA